MNNAKRANAILWTGNVVLIIAIVAFAFQFLIFPELKTHDLEAPISVPPLTGTTDPTDTQALAKLPNPLLPPAEKGPQGPTGPVKLIGTDKIKDDPTSDTAYLELPARKLNVNAYKGEVVKDDSTGVEVPELVGWKLESVTPKSATFSTPGGSKTLQLEEITASVTPVGLGGTNPLTPVIGQPWEPAKYTSKKNAGRSNDSQEAWDIDKKEMEWAAANVDTILTGVSLEPYAGGGLKINALPEGGFAAERGLRAGDVLRSVNGQQIDSLARLSEIMKGLSKNATTLNVQVDRSGRMYTLSYTVPRTPPR